MQSGAKKTNKKTEALKHIDVDDTETVYLGTAPSYAKARPKQRSLIDVGPWKIQLAVIKLSATTSSVSLFHYPEEDGKEEQRFSFVRCRPRSRIIGTRLAVSCLRMKKKHSPEKQN